MREADVTPLPTTVAADPVPRARDSAGSFAVEVSPQEQPMVRQATRSRSLFKKLIAPAIAIPAMSAAVVAGPNTLYAINDSSQTEGRAAVAKIEAETPPAALQFAQLTAAQKLFWVKNQGADVKAAQAEASRYGKAEPLEASDYLDPTQVSISQNGDSFTVDGKEYQLARRKTEEGNVYILAGRHLVEERILSDRNRLVGSLLVGGAKNDLSSDLNKDGVVTPEEVTLSADQSARHNLDRAFQTPQRIVVGQNDVKQK